MREIDLFNYKRTCVRCKRSMPMRGAITYPKFICGECRPKPAPAKKAA